MTQTILVYSMGEVIGDGLIKLPFIAGLRAAFPDAQHQLVRRQGRDGLCRAAQGRRRAGYIDEVIVERRDRRQRPWTACRGARPFGGRRFDLVIDTQENLRRSAVARRAAAGRFVSAARQARSQDWPLAVTDRLADCWPWRRTGRARQGPYHPGPSRRF